MPKQDPNNYIQSVRELLDMKQSDLVEVLKNIDERIGCPELSKIENGLLLPTVPLMREICKAIGMFPKKLYKSGALSLASALNPSPCCRDESIYYQFKVRLPQEYRGKITDDILQASGYVTREQWLIDCIKHLQYKTKEPASTDS